MWGLSTGWEEVNLRPVTSRRAITTTATTTSTKKFLATASAPPFGHYPSRIALPPENNHPSAAAARTWHTKRGQSTPITFSASCHGPDDHRRRRGTMTPCEPPTSPTLEISATTSTPATLSPRARAQQRCRCRRSLPRSLDVPRTAFIPFYHSRRHDRRQDRQTSTSLFGLTRCPPAGHRPGALSLPQTKVPPISWCATLYNLQ